MFFLFNKLLFSDDNGMPSYSSLMVFNFPETDKALCFVFVFVAMHTAIYNTQVSLRPYNFTNSMRVHHT
jgi:hypothetical protein